MNLLQHNVESYIGEREFPKTEIPEYIIQSLNRSLRPYQKDALKYFLRFWEINSDPKEDFKYKQKNPELLFHMATGSGKTIIMAACILKLYSEGYRNFLFTTNQTNIISKTKDNFLHSYSSKYLFNSDIYVNNLKVKIREVDNFQNSSKDSINLCLKSLQILWSLEHNIKENSLSIEDFANEPVVIIADEAHHLNSDTKEKKNKDPQIFDTEDNLKFDEASSWESIVMKILNTSNGKMPNVLLEFTATEDLKNPNIAEKYNNKIIFDYQLKKFCHDGYSKRVEAVIGSLTPMERALQAIIVSQYKKKLFASIMLDEKPVVFFKSSTKTENKKNFYAFHKMVSNLNVNDISHIRSIAKDIVKDAFNWFDSHNISDENLIIELQEDFSANRSIRIDSSTTNEEEQETVNSLEEKNNIIRTIFAVEKLNEGWDVLNLYDIVRLNNPKGSSNGKPSKVTNQEAQLIGRGARYLPFADPSDDSLPIDKRKYDSDGNNPLQGIETLHYHCYQNSDYIRDLNKALEKMGMPLDGDGNAYETVYVKMKDSFKQSELYKKGIIYVNKRVKLSEVEKKDSLGKSILSKTFICRMPSEKVSSEIMLNGQENKEIIDSESTSINFIDLGSNIIRSALNFFPSLYFNKLKIAFPKLKSITEFITSPSYLRNINVQVFGRVSNIEEYNNKEKLTIAKDIIKQIEPTILQYTRSYVGSKEFYAHEIRNTFTDVIKHNFSVHKDNSKEEKGVSMKYAIHEELRKDLSKEDWFAYEDCYGTEEEKSLVMFINDNLSNLKEKYEQIYLIRSEQDISLYSFKDGSKYEPDFVLFLKRKNSESLFDYWQIFIEPKAANLMLTDKWKEDLLLSLKNEAQIFLNKGQFKIWGLPFYNRHVNMDNFKAEFNKIIE